MYQVNHREDGCHEEGSCASCKRVNRSCRTSTTTCQKEITMGRSQQGVSGSAVELRDIEKCCREGSKIITHGSRVMDPI